MKLADVQQALVKKGINELRCPLCSKKGQWSLDENTYELRKFNKGAFVVGNNPIVPLVLLTHDCGYVYVINAISLGVFENE